jgi:GAF domain-containing protein
VPLIARDGTNIGLIQASDKYAGEFTEEDETILVQLAQLAAVAIENAQFQRDTATAREVAEQEARRTAQFDPFRGTQHRLAHARGLGLGRE